MQLKYCLKFKFSVLLGLGQKYMEVFLLSVKKIYTTKVLNAYLFWLIKLFFARKNV